MILNCHHAHKNTIELNFNSTVLTAIAAFNQTAFIVMIKTMDKTTHRLAFLLAFVVKYGFTLQILTCDRK